MEGDGHDIFESTTPENTDRERPQSEMVDSLNEVQTKCLLNTYLEHCQYIELPNQQQEVE